MQPALPPSIPVQQFKLFLVGRAGCGKTCLVSWLAGLPGWSYQLGESPGVRVSQVTTTQSVLLLAQFLYHY